MGKTQKPEGEFVALADFRDIDNFDVAYNEGDDVSHLSDERILTLLDKKLIAPVQEAAAATGKESSPQATANAAKTPAKRAAAKPAVKKVEEKAPEAPQAPVVSDVKPDEPQA